MKLRSAWMLLLLTCFALGVRGEYPSFEQAGFRNCALIYGKETRSAADFLPMVIKTSPEGRPESPFLFDAFLFLLKKVNNIATENGATRMADWEQALAIWFAPGRDLAELDRAIELAVTTGGETPPRKVILMIPWMDPALADFGDVDGDGRSENLKLPADRAKVAAWFVRTARERLAAAKYRHLVLHGFYWMHESIAEDPAMIKVVADEVKSGGFKFFWIPYFNAAGLERWRDCGFDAAFLQSNYAFTSPVDGGGTLRNRLDITAERAKKIGMGFEVEFRRGELDPAGRLMLRRTFDAGARYGFQNAPQAWYLETEMLLHASPDPDNRALYGELVHYLAGEPVRLPDLDRWQVGSENGKTVYTATFPAPEAVGLLEIAFDPVEPGKSWRGIISAQVLSREKWENAGWIYRGPPAAADGAFPMSAIRLDGKAAPAVRLVFDGPGMPEVKSISRDYPLPPKHRALSSGKSYRSNFPAVLYAYPDRTGRQLLDGVNFSNGFREYVGWGGSGRTDVAFNFRDAAAGGTPFEFDEVRVHTRRDRSAAVDFPSDPLLFLARDGDWRGGVLPAGLRVIEPAATKVERLNDDADFGVIRFAVDPPATEKSMLFSSSHRQWLMLSEVEFFRQGKKLAVDAVRYQLLTPPQRSGRVPYADDGRLLTDGDGLDSWSASKVAGLSDGRLIEVVIDLGSPSAVSQVSAWSFGGGRNGIYAPRSARVAFSDDGVTWSDPVDLAIPKLDEDRRKLEVVVCRADFPSRVTRYVKLEIQGRHSWCMLGEITVE